ncbi:hypothetical protein [Nocardiopsis sp. CNT312]|uniref:hypothetical protein n=1 Tax=Nocardiopsis sp. CNT312 TaxID=1137268 RepID=UPI0006854732|nr:hypothetical protein [Nocardiopsis sp. CNT312]
MTIAIALPWRCSEAIRRVCPTGVARVRGRRPGDAPGRDDQDVAAGEGPHAVGEGAPRHTGPPTRIIERIPLCLDKPRTIHLSGVAPEVLAALERDRVTHRAECPANDRGTVSEYLDAVHGHPFHGASGPGRTPASPCSPRPSTHR